KRESVARQTYSGRQATGAHRLHQTVRGSSPLPIADGREARGEGQRLPHDAFAVVNPVHGRVAARGGDTAMAEIEGGALVAAALRDQGVEMVFTVVGGPVIETI